MDDWLSHYYFDTHQLRARNAAVEAVASAPAGERLVILTDWAEKLGLVPPSSSTGGTYEQLGLLMNVCIYKVRHTHTHTHTHTHLQGCERGASGDTRRPGRFGGERRAAHAHGPAEDCRSLREPQQAAKSQVDVHLYLERWYSYYNPN